MNTKEKTYKEAINDLTEYLNEGGFDNEYIEEIYEYLLNTKIKIKD